VVTTTNFNRFALAAIETAVISRARARIKGKRPTFADGRLEGLVPDRLFDAIKKWLP
jgi:hypothetical protein